MRRLSLGLSLALWACSDDPVALGPPDLGADASIPDLGSAEDLGVVADGGTPADAGAPDDAGVPGDPELVILFGTDVSSTLRAALEAELRAVETRPVRIASDLTRRPPAGSLVLAIGKSPVAEVIIPSGEVALLGAEGFILRSGFADGVPVLATYGEPELNAPGANLGTGFGAYALLEALGYGFLHPLAPVRPERLPDEAPNIERSERPAWAIRGLQLHTMHPLELTDLLNGWGPAGPNDASGWEAGLPEWERYLAWMLANRQNRVHWVLLIGDSWADFADGAERIARLSRLVDLAHGYGVQVGVDVPIALHQQHAYRLLRTDADLSAELAEIRGRADHLMAAGFDYLATENGSSEFTAPPASDLLAWMDGLATHLDQAHGKPAYIKIHVSLGQYAEGFVDPATGGPLNINFLPHYAVPELGVMPHTVQAYGLDDPAPTYGNTNFEPIMEFLFQELPHRTVIWHPETAYWVSHDVDVPLFLPLYAERRASDLRLLMAEEELRKKHPTNPLMGHLDGQLTFSSGWEWGYWLNDVITARASWNPRLASGGQAFVELLEESLGVFGPAKAEVARLLNQIALEQRDLLIFGRVNGVGPADVTKRNGLAYLQGVDPWDDVAELAVSLGGLGLGPATTQPDKLGLVEMRNPLHDPPGYSAEVEPLLAAMALTMKRHADDLAALAPQIPVNARPLYDDLVDAARLTALRARQVHGLYDYVDGFFDLDQGPRRARLADARAALDEAIPLVAARDARYRVDPDRIAGWRDGPTAYEYGYLWSVRTLYYWWRDEGKAVDAPVSPCYLNVINPLDVGFGEGLYADAGRIARDVFDGVPGLGALTECLAETRNEPTFPQDNLRSRP